MPANYREAQVPNSLIDEMTGSHGNEIAWVRCIDCDQDWKALGRHIQVATGKYGYTNTTEQWLPAMTKESGLTLEQGRNIFKFYSSRSGNCHVMMINLDFIRDTYGSSVGTGGDFVITVIYDNVEYYK